MAAGVGTLSSLTQTIELISHLKNPTAKLACDLSSVFSCANVFDAWQSRVFGFSNSLICLIFFALTAGVALAAATDTKLTPRLRFVFHFFSVFFLGFGAWYLWQSTYRIGYICIFCLFCYGAVIVLNWAWFRLNYQEIKLNKQAKSKLTNFVNDGGDIFIAILWALLIATMIVNKFW